MPREQFQEYLMWRRDRLERQYWKHTRTVRNTGFIMFLLLIGLGIGAYTMLNETEPLSKMHLYVYLAVGLIAMVALVMHADARSRRQDIQEELSILYSITPPPETVGYYQDPYDHTQATQTDNAIA